MTLVSLSNKINIVNRERKHKTQNIGWKIQLTWANFKRRTKYW